MSEIFKGGATPPSLKELSDKAAPGMWYSATVVGGYANNGEPYSLWVSGAGPRVLTVDRSTVMHADDMKFIAALVNAYRDGDLTLRSEIGEKNAAPQASATLSAERREGGPDTDGTRGDAKPGHAGACGAAPDNDLAKRLRFLAAERRHFQLGVVDDDLIAAANLIENLAKAYIAEREVLLEARRSATVGSPMLCSKHGGYGFTSDCRVCNAAPQDAASGGVSQVPVRVAGALATAGVSDDAGSTGGPACAAPLVTGDLATQRAIHDRHGDKPRANFERYAAEQGCTDFERNEFDGYRNSNTELRWTYWKAALASLSSVAAKTPRTDTFIPIPENAPYMAVLSVARDLEARLSATAWSEIREALKDMADDLADHINAGKLKCEVCVGHVNNARDLLSAYVPPSSKEKS